jgi:serine/threonine-protein kinase
MFFPSANRSIPKPGEVIADRYEVGEVLGKGGMGVVVAAKHVELRREVAIKLLHPDLLADQVSLARFLREARLMASLESEHVTRIHDVGRLPDGTPFMVMERLHGVDLHSVTKRGALPIENAVDIVLQAGEALAEAHAHGIVHRDLKPANLFVAKRNDGVTLIKVMDFGISKLLAGSRPGGLELTFDAGLTAPATLMGTPHYISPEQILSAHTVDARADVWALGAILHRLIAGSPPFDASDALEILRLVMAEPPAPLRSRCPAAPPALEAAILQCLEKDLDRRTPSVAALARAIAPFAPARSQVSVTRILKIAGEALPGGAAPAPPVPPEPVDARPLTPSASAPPTQAPVPSAVPSMPTPPSGPRPPGTTAAGLRWPPSAGPPVSSRSPAPASVPVTGLRLKPRKG